MAELRSKKQEAFVQKVVQGMPQRDAFRAVYKNNMTDAQVDAEASNMINGTGKYSRDPKIHLRYLELHKKATEEAEANSIATAVEMKQALTSIIRQQLEEEVIVIENTGDFCTEARKMKKTAAIKDIISAINSLGKMEGLFVDKAEVDVDISPIVIKDDIVE